MSNRIPSSLKWLIDKRARLDGEIRKTRASLNNAQRLIDELSKLETDLEAIDRSLGLHEIKVDLANIAPVRGHYVRIKLPHGELTRSVLLCLRLNKGTPVRMSEIASFIATRHANLESEELSRAKLHRSVHNCLKRLCRNGILKRHHPTVCATEGVWSLADDVTC